MKHDKNCICEGVLDMEGYSAKHSSTGCSNTPLIIPSPTQVCPECKKTHCKHYESDFDKDGTYNE